jgi:hypothetical protein
MEKDSKSTETVGAGSEDGARLSKRLDLGLKSEPTNSIRPSRQRARASTKAAHSPGSAAPENTRDRARETATSATAGRLIPDHIRKRFVQVGHRYYFSDGAHAFTDRGARLITRVKTWRS